MKLLFAALSALALLSASLVSSQQSLRGVSVGFPLVAVELYYESLCPYCRRWIFNQLMPLFSSPTISPLFSIDIVPYGNAKEKLDDASGQYEFTCQHGPDECYLNLVEACAIDYLEAPAKYLPFVACIEDPSVNGKDWTTCGDSTLVDAVTRCVTSAQGNALMHGHAQRTNALQPPHKYVPWIVINGKPNEDANADFKKVLCDALAPLVSPLPPDCSGSGPATYLAEVFEEANYTPVDGLALPAVAWEVEGGLSVLTM